MQPIKVVDGTNVQIKSDSTQSIDVQISGTQFINILLPNDKILVVEPTQATLFDSTESAVGHMSY